MYHEHNHHQETGQHDLDLDYDNPVFSAGFEKGYSAAKAIAETLIAAKEAQILSLQTEIAALRGQAQ